MEKSDEGNYINLRPLPELEVELSIPLTGKLAEEVAPTDRKAPELVCTSYTDLLDRTRQACYRELVNSGVSVEIATNIIEYGAQRQLYMKKNITRDSCRTPCPAEHIWEGGGHVHRSHNWWNVFL